MKQKAYLILFFLFFTVSCATGQGQINPFPSINDKSSVSNIAVKRDTAFLGYAQTFTFTIDGKDIYMFRSGDEISFQIDPGEHLFGVKCHGGWQITGNFSEIAQDIEPNKSYKFRIIPDMNRGCRIERSSLH